MIVNFLWVSAIVYVYIKIQASILYKSANISCLKHRIGLIEKVKYRRNDNKKSD